MIRFPAQIDEVLAALTATAGARLRAGGVDDHALRSAGIVGGPIVDLRDLASGREIERTARGGLRIGAGVTIAALATHDLVRERYGALAQAAGALATPQIRAQATVAGNLLQQVRCWYFREPSFHCLKRGGATCHAREGDHSEHSVFDHSACVAPHPSTLAMVLGAFEAQVEIEGSDRNLRSIPELLGSGTDPRHTHDLEGSALVTAVVLPPVPREERSAYARTTARARADWALVEGCVRLEQSSDGLIERAVVWAGGVAVRPLELSSVADSLVGLDPTGGAIGGVLAQLEAPAPSLPQAAYKAQLLPPTLHAALRAATLPVPAEEADASGSP